MSDNEEYEVEAQLVEISEEPIALCQLLKIANLVSGGGEAKVVISEGYVYLNNEVEYQKRKKVYHNDIIQFNGEVIQVSVNENIASERSISVPKKSKNTSQSPRSKNQKKQKAANIAAKKPNNSDETFEAPTITRGRRPISF